MSRLATDVPPVYAYTSSCSKARNICANQCRNEGKMILYACFPVLESNNLSTKLVCVTDVIKCWGWSTLLHPIISSEILNDHASTLLYNLQPMPCLKMFLEFGLITCTIGLLVSLDTIQNHSQPLETIIFTAFSFEKFQLFYLQTPSNGNSLCILHICNCNCNKIDMQFTENSYSPISQKNLLEYWHKPVVLVV